LRAALCHLNLLNPSWRRLQQCREGSLASTWRSMVKAYLRYEFEGAFGVVTSGARSCFDVSGKLFITSALDNVIVWNVKQGTQARAVAALHASLTKSGKGREG
jgi:hypothetical protein